MNRLLQTQKCPTGSKSVGTHRKPVLVPRVLKPVNEVNDQWRRFEIVDWEDKADDAGLRMDLRLFKRANNRNEMSAKPLCDFAGYGQ